MKGKLIFIAKAGLSVGLLGVVCWKVDWTKFVMPQKSGNTRMLFLAVVAGIVFNLVKFLKWQNLIRQESGPGSYMDAAKSYIIGNSLGLATPLRVGELGRALYFDKEHRPRIVSLTVIDRLVELAAVLILAVVGILFLIGRSLGILVGVCAVAGIAIIYGIEKFLWVAKKAIPRIERWEKANRYLAMLTAVNSKAITINLVLSFVAFVTVILELYFLVAAFENTTVVSAFLVGPLITLSSIMPVSFMGLGVREGISVLLYRNFGVSGPTAVAAAFLLFVINNLLIGIAGILFLWRLLPVKQMCRDSSPL